MQLSSSFFLWISFIFTHAVLLSCLVNCLGGVEESLQTNSDSLIHSAAIIPFDKWLVFKIAPDSNNSNNSDDLYLPNNWEVFISSNETILSDGACHLFHKFVCSSPDCYEDSSSTYSHQSPKFSSNDATRLNLKPRIISIADGAWQINPPLLYIHSCDTSVAKESNAPILGQIGLGLSGKAFQNFQTPNPIFSIIFHNTSSAELIFGFKPTYVNDSAKGVSLPCDLDWKVQVNSVIAENSTLVSSLATLIFDLQALSISLPEAYFINLRNYFFNISEPEECLDQIKGSVSFLCFRNSLQDLPSLIFSLESGAQFVLTPEAYTMAISSLSYTVRFVLYNSTFSGTEYIILGRKALFHYYSVFEKVIDQAPTITLYPVNHDPIDTNIQLQIKSNSSKVEVESNNPSQIIPSLNKTLNSNNDSKITQVESTSETHNNDHVGESDYSLYVTGIIIMFVLMICGTVGYLYWKGRGQELLHDKMRKVHRPTLELNESSYFVSSNNINVHESEISESE